MDLNCLGLNCKESGGKVTQWVVFLPHGSRISNCGSQCLCGVFQVLWFPHALSKNMGDFAKLPLGVNKYANMYDALRWTEGRIPISHQVFLG